MALLSSWPRVGHFDKDKREWFVVGKNCKIPALEEVTEMPSDEVKSKELLIECVVLPLQGSQLTAEKGKWLPVTVDKLFENSIYGCVRCVDRESC